MRLDINDLKRGTLIVIDGGPYSVLSVKHTHMGRGGASVQSKIKDLRSGKVLDRTFKPSDNVDEADIRRMDVKFIYERKGEYWFHEPGKPEKRFSLGGVVLGEQGKFLKPNMEVKAFLFSGNVINVELPIKAGYKVIEAPPSIRGNTSQGGNKPVVIEGGAKINVPLFIEEGDTIRVNTETGEYAERVS
jgi:elongation factor P